MTERELFFKYLGLPSFHPIGLEIEKAEGIYLFNKAGKRYFDLVSGISVSNIGHRHPKVLDAIRQQTEKYLYLNVYGEFIQSPQVNLAKLLTELLPASLQAVYFVNSGSEAVEGAIKLAKRFTGRTEIIAFRNAYHGSTQGALSVLGHEELKNAFRPLIPDVRFLDFGNFEDLRMITSRTAAVITETIQSEAGVIIPGEGYLFHLRKRCVEAGTLLIIDDVQLGFGRTGKLFSFEHPGIIPDILVLAKAMGGGMPIGVFISSREIMDSLAFNPELGHITTFGGHPVSCAAAIANLEVILGERLTETVEEKGLLLEKGIKKHDLVKEVRRKGMMLGIEVKDPGIRRKLTEQCLQNGIIIDWFLFHPATFRITPPLTITFDDIETAIDLLIRSLDEV